MLEVQIRAEVERLQTRRDSKIKHSLPSQADCVPGQAERTAAPQLQSPNRQRLADQADDRAVPLSADRRARRCGCRAPRRTARRHTRASKLRFPNSAADCRVSPEKTVRASRCSRPPGITSASKRLPMTLPSRRTGLTSRVCFRRLRRQYVRRYDAYASTALESTSTPAALQPNIIAVLSVVPRPHSGSRIEAGLVLERLIEASVTLINNRVNCSLVFPGYFGMVDQIVVEEILRTHLDRQQSIMLTAECGIATGQPPQRLAESIIKDFCRQRQIADTGHGNGLDWRMLVSAQHDLQLSRDQPMCLGRINTIGRGRRARSDGQPFRLIISRGRQASAGHRGGRAPWLARSSL